MQGSPCSGSSAHADGVDLDKAADACGVALRHPASSGTSHTLGKKCERTLTLRYLMSSFDGESSPWRVDSEYKSEFAWTYIALGGAKGRAAGEAKALLTARGIEMGAKTRGTIMSCTDPEQPERWIMRSATASSLDEMLVET